MRPAAVHWCDGTAAEREWLAARLVAAGTLERLSRPGSYLARTDARERGRVAERTFVCSEHERDAGPTNRWRDPEAMRVRLRERLRGCARGRALYVVPFLLGPPGSAFARAGVQVTDSAYAALSMSIMTRVGRAALAADAGPVRCLHASGAPGDVSPWPCDPANVCVAHFPERREVWSYGSSFGGNALLGKTGFGLRIASVLGRDEGWLAEHMLLLKLTSPAGRSKYLAGAFPSGCGKSHLALLAPTLPGWKVETLGDDIAWIRIGGDGRLRAVNPEAGFFSAVPEPSPNALATVRANALFTNCARTPDGDVWWEGLTPDPPPGLRDWRGEPWRPGDGAPAAHPLASVAVPATQCPSLAAEWDDPAGVPLDAILLGGRRSSDVPLVREALGWQHGVLLGATLRSEPADGARGPRFDPFAMSEFCGYDMGSYFAHWLAIGARAGARAPKVFVVNWFRADRDGRLLWPGFGENSRVLKWIFERCDGDGASRATAIGRVPAAGALDVDGLDLRPGALAEMLRVDDEGVRAEERAAAAYLERFGDRLPATLAVQLDQMSWTA